MNVYKASILAGVAAFAVLMSANAMLAQQAKGVGTATAQSASQAASLSAAQGGNVNLYAAPAEQRIVTNSSQDYSGSYRVENVPQVSAPGFSSGHPCAYAPISFGVGIVGGGASAGGQRIDNACLLAQMGYKREAMAMIAARDPAAMQALQATGQVQRSSASAQPASASTKAPARPPALLSKCEKDGANVRIAYTSAGRQNKAAAKAACLQSLGF